MTQRFLLPLLAFLALTMITTDVRAQTKKDEPASPLTEGVSSILDALEDDPEEKKDGKDDKDGKSGDPNKEPATPPKSDDNNTADTPPAAPSEDRSEVARAQLDDGRQVILFDDGTWQYAPPVADDSASNGAANDNKTDVTAPTPPPAPAPEATPTVAIYDNWNKQTCRRTHRAAFTIPDGAGPPTKLVIWYNWRAGETTAKGRLADGDSRSIGQLVFQRGGCDVNQRNWCEGIAEIDLELDPGDYMVRMNRSRLCTNDEAERNGFIRVMAEGTAPADPEPMAKKEPVPAKPSQPEQPKAPAAAPAKPDVAKKPVETDLGSIPGYRHTPKAAISGHNRRHLTGVSPAECAQLCDIETSFICKSFDYYVQRKACDLSDKSAADVGGLKTDYPGSPYDHYARTGASAPQTTAPQTPTPQTTAPQTAAPKKPVPAAPATGNSASIPEEFNGWMAWRDQSGSTGLRLVITDRQNDGGSTRMTGKAFYRFQGSDSDMEAPAYILIDGENIFITERPATDGADAKAQGGFNGVYDPVGKTIKGTWTQAGISRIADFELKAK